MSPCLRVMKFSAIDVTLGQHCGDDHGGLYVGDDPRATTTYFNLRARSSPSRWPPFKSLSMLTKTILTVTALLCGVAYSWPQQYASSGGGPNSDGKYTLQAPGIRAQFIPYGASITNLFINDKNGRSSRNYACPTSLTLFEGIERDIVLGFDNATYYSIDTSHPHLGGVPGTTISIHLLILALILGRYANRIKNRYTQFCHTKDLHLTFVPALSKSTA
jgi:hypothetical protein